METTGFFVIHIDDPGQKQTPEGESASGYSLRLGWIQGVPYLLDLGGSGEVLVNATPVEPNTLVIIQAGDVITIGNTHLTWNAGTATAQPGREPASPPVSSDKPDPPGPADPAMLVPEQMADQVGAETPDPILHVQGALQQPVPEKPDDEAAPSPEVAERPEDATTYKTVWVDMDQLLKQDAKDLEFVSTTILRDTRSPHLVIHLPDRTWETRLTKEAMIIGRSKSSDIPIPHESVSQRHAMIERRGNDFVIRDTQSKNGVWLGKQRVEEHTLRSGDELRLGPAKLIFKAGFTSNDLTLIGTPRIDGKPARRPVVFVPGLMGSQLWIGSQLIWPDIKMIISNPELFRLPGDPRIEARGIVNDVVVVPHIIQSRQYSALGDYMESGLGYTRGKDLLEFSYDWRQDIRLSARRLAEAIEDWHVKAPVTIIGHSLGTLVTRYYVEKLGGKQFTERIILMGGPHYGTPKSIASVLFGPKKLPFGLGNERMRQVLATFHSTYQILPTYPCVVDQNGDHIDIMKDGSWLPEHLRQFLGAGRGFWREVGTTSSVPAVSIFGYGLKTQVRIKVERGPDGAWQQVDFIEEMAGDQSVPAGSAVLKDSEIHPVFQEHGSLYVDDDVKMRLKVELTRSTTWQKKR
jgi:pSer/pThr/pTyr-binding forkhead associated (FHA) protein